MAYVVARVIRSSVRANCATDVPASPNCRMQRSVCDKVPFESYGSRPLILVLGVMFNVSRMKPLRVAAVCCVRVFSVSACERIATSDSNATSFSWWSCREHFSMLRARYR